MTDKSRLAIFRTDAGSTIGWGHVMRCSALANCLRAAGWRCVWVTASRESAIRARLSTRFDEVVGLAPRQDEPEAMRNRWRGGCHLLVIDHYERDACFGAACRGWADRILVIDDLPERAHDCDLLLDTAPGHNEQDYRRRVPEGTQLLLGPDYALLMPEYAATRRRAIPRSYKGAAKQVLVALGATNPGDLLDKILDAIEQASVALSPDLVLSWNMPDIERLSARAEHAGGRVHVDVKNMAELMVGADLAIGAGGNSAWERCTLGLPTLLLVIAENQQINAKALDRVGAVRVVAPEIDSLVGAIDSLAGDPYELKNMSAAAARLADGLGAIRVSQAVVAQPEARDGQVVRLRPVRMTDADTLLAWQRQPETRRFARNPQIPERSEHVRWMADKLDDPDCLMNIILHGEVPAGVARLDRMSEGYEVSIAIDPGRFRLGLGRIALTLLHDLVSESDLWAHVHAENLASQALFRSSGYCDTELSGWLVHRGCGEGGWCP